MSLEEQLAEARATIDLLTRERDEAKAKLKDLERVLQDRMRLKVKAMNLALQSVDIDHKGQRL